MKQHIVRKRFLTEFVRQLMNNYVIMQTQGITAYVPQAEFNPEQNPVKNDSLEERTEHDIRSAEMEPSNEESESPAPVKDYTVEYETSEEVGDTSKKENTQKELPLVPEPSEQRMIEIKEPLGFGKLDPLLTNPLVQSIECLSDQPVKIIENKELVQLPLIISAGELAEIIVKCAEVTGARLQENILSGESKELIVTAVVSEFAGSRLVIHKKSNVS